MVDFKAFHFVLINLLFESLNVLLLLLKLIVKDFIFFHGLITWRQQKFVFLVKGKVIFMSLAFNVLI